MLFKKKQQTIQILINSYGELKEDSFKFNLIEKYFRKKDISDSFQVLSDKTCNDLDFHALFMFIDRTYSKIGQQYLYYKLRTIPITSEKINKNEELVDLFINNQDFRLSVQKQLMKLKHANAFYITTLFQDKYIKPPKWFFIIKLLSFTSLLSLILIPIRIQMVLVFLGVFIINIVIHLWNKKNLYQYLDSIPQLLLLIKIAREFFKKDILKTINPNLSKSFEITSKIKIRMSLFKMEARLINDFESLIWSFLELIKIAFLIEPLFLFGVLKQLDTRRKEIEDIFKFVGEIDSIISIASLRTGLSKYCKPLITETKKKLSLKEAYHPLINNCIENDIEIDTKSILLTGSNMSGKTSFIRTVGINVITGLTINTCFAKAMSMPRMSIYSAIRISDDLLNDKSYYFEEVLTIKDMLDKSRDEKYNLFLLDEIFKGTNTIERISAGKAVLSYLSQGNNWVCVSTHDIELVDLLKDKYDLYHFSEKVENKNVDFDFKLKKGKLTSRNAIRILQINDYPEKIIEEAFKLSKELDKTHQSGLGL